MSDLFAFLTVGFRHIVGLDAADHILFLAVLSAIYRPRDWRIALVVISAFTVGHSVTLVLAVTRLLVLPSRIVEFLIPVTIAATAVENLWWRAQAERGVAMPARPLFAAVFGLVHGAGFAGYLQSLFVDDIALPLVGFNIGIELGQIVVLAGAAAVYALVDAALRALLAQHTGGRRFELRLVAVSTLGLLVATAWAVERFPR
jgi:hypothetical protein